MYLFKTKVKKSKIEGLGLFADEDIKKGSVVWKFEVGHDKVISQEEFLQLDDKKQKEMEKIGFLSPISGIWICPPKDDCAQYTNHSQKENNLSAVFDKSVSQEPFFKANRDILIGEELLVNYLEFDEFTKNNQSEWI